MPFIPSVLNLAQRGPCSCYYPAGMSWSQDLWGLLLCTCSDPYPARGMECGWWVISSQIWIFPKVKEWQEGKSLPKNHVLRKLTLSNAPFPFQHHCWGAAQAHYNFPALNVFQVSAHRFPAPRALPCLCAKPVSFLPGAFKQRSCNFSFSFWLCFSFFPSLLGKLTDSVPWFGPPSLSTEKQMWGIIQRVWWYGKAFPSSPEAQCLPCQSPSGCFP